MLWKIAQFAVFCVLTVVLHELDRTIPIGAAIIVAVALTAVIFAPLLHLAMWLKTRR